MTDAPIRLLVIDNYDSFTYNLVHGLEAYTGAEPVVIRNDAEGWHTGILDDFDAVVISPGPGRPDRAADFGICADVISSVRVPLLGVCLGHQGICYRFGARVVPAPEPFHGRSSDVRHVEDQLFGGIPSPFRAVRYHSLMVDRIPATLEIIADTDDGVVMAVRHRNRPLYGVQFHPESICTEHGERLLSNFVDLARDWRAAQSARAGRSAPPSRMRDVETWQRSTSTRGSAESGADGGRPTHRVLWRKLACEIDAESVFHAVYCGADYAFWLDSSMAHGDRGRFSFMGDAAGPLARIASADVRHGTIDVIDAQSRRVHRTPFFDWLRDDLAAHRIETTSLPFDFTLGWVGYLGYELKTECRGADVHASPYPDAYMLFADRVIAFDHARAEVYLLALAVDGDEQPAVAWLNETDGRLTGLRSAESISGPVAHHLGEPVLRHPHDTYLKLIDICQQEIRAGESYEICLTNTVEIPGHLDPWPAYRTLRRDHQTPHAAFLRMGDLSVLSSSPEQFLRIGADRVTESRPIKGTRPRGTSAAEDERLRAELASSEKERAENLMIVDLVRNDLGSCAEAGSVTVTCLFDIETYSTVHQLVSTVRSRIADGVSAVDCVRAAFPGGSMTGAPKIRTMDIIDSLEGAARGIYSGTLGYFSLSGAVDLSMTIRTIVATPGYISFGVGGAITALSDPEAEYAETAVKAANLMSLIGRQFPV